MKYQRISAAPRRAVNLSLDPAVVTAARELGINLSQACEQGLASEIAAVRGEIWLRENIDALEAWNVWIEKNGLPLQEYRQF